MDFFFTESLTNCHYKDYQRFPALLFESHNNTQVPCIEIEFSAARIYLYIGECGSTLYVGLSGIVRNLIQKSTGWDHTFLSIFFFSTFNSGCSGLATIPKPQ